MTKQVGKITDFKKWDAARKLETSSFLGAQAENLSMGTGFWQPAAFAFWSQTLLKYTSVLNSKEWCMDPTLAWQQ